MINIGLLRFSISSAISFDQIFKIIRYKIKDLKFLRIYLKFFTPL